MGARIDQSESQAQCRQAWIRLNEVTQEGFTEAKKSNRSVIQPGSSLGRGDT